MIRIKNGKILPVKQYRAYLTETYFKRVEHKEAVTLCRKGIRVEPNPMRK